MCSGVYFENDVLFCTLFPGNIFIHIADHHIIPGFSVLEIERLCSVDRIVKQPAFISVKCKTVSWEKSAKQYKDMYVGLTPRD